MNHHQADRREEADRARSPRPIVGISCDLTEPTPGRPRAECGLGYARCVAQAGGVAVLLPPIAELVESHLQLCDAIVLTGGDDPRIEAFGEPTHPLAKPMHEQRQAFELALLAGLERAAPARPVLGVCLGMQLMSLHAGGRLHQHMPENIPTHALHAQTHHAVSPHPGGEAPAGLTLSGQAYSNHRQAVAHPGRLRVLARAPDGIVEAVGDPSRRFYVGVQWHPERTADRPLGQAVFDALIAAARAG